MVLVSLGIISARFLTMFSAAAANASASAVASPLPFMKLSHAAFAEFMEPSMVVAASFCVVPVMSSSPWITWIAL